MVEKMAENLGGHSGGHPLGDMLSKESKKALEGVFREGVKDKKDKRDGSGKNAVPEESKTQQNIDKHEALKKFKKETRGNLRVVREAPEEKPTKSSSDGKGFRQIGEKFMDELLKIQTSEEGKVDRPQQKTPDQIRNVKKRGDIDIKKTRKRIFEVNALSNYQKERLSAVGYSEDRIARMKPHEITAAVAKRQVNKDKKEIKQTPQKTPDQISFEKMLETKQFIDKLKAREAEIDKEFEKIKARLKELDINSAL